MASRWAITGGTFSDPNIWNNGATLGIPVVGDDVWANGFTIDMDTSINLNSLQTNGGSPIISLNRIPIMTSNSTPSGLASASSGSGDAWRAFDGLAGTGWRSVGVGLGDVTYQLTSGIIAKRYAVRNFGGTTDGPRNWNFQGSNDGVTWTTLEAVTGVNLGATGRYTSPILSNTLSYTRYRLNITANNGASTTYLSDFEVTDSTSTETFGGSTGGAFRFSVPNVNVVTQTLTTGSATAVVSITLTGGTSSLTTNNAQQANSSNAVSNILHSGTGNFIFTCPSMFAANAGTSLIVFLNKTGNGTLTINCPTITTGTNAGSGMNTIANSAGNLIINGNLSSNAGSAVNNTGGNLTINGNIVGGGGSSCVAFTTSSVLLTVNGNVIGGTTNNNGRGINATAGNIIVNGNITGGTAGVGIFHSGNLTVSGDVRAAGVSAIETSSLNTITVDGNVFASSTAVGINANVSNSFVILNGNLSNVNGRQAVFSQRLQLGTGTTQANFFTFGGQDRTLYSLDNFPNLPPTSSVTLNTLYGPNSGLTGTMVVASPSDTRVNVPVGDTVGTATLTPEDLFNAITGSTNDVAIRLRNVSTVQSTGDQVASYN